MKSNALIKITTILNIIILVMIGAVIFLKKTMPEEEYYAYKPNSSPFRIPGQDYPSHSMAGISSWAQNAVVQTYTMNFVDLDKNVNDIKKLFTPDGFKTLENSWRKSGRLYDIATKQLRTFAVVEGVPVILQNVLLGKWVMQIPLLLSYEGSSENIQNDRTIVFLEISRVPGSVIETGLGISHLSEAKSNGIV